jgi:hypothetical protein
VRGVEHDQAGATRHQPFQLGEVVAKAIFRPDSPEIEVAADRARHAVELLVRGRNGNDVISGFE